MEDRLPAPNDGFRRVKRVYCKLDCSLIAERLAVRRSAFRGLRSDGERLVSGTGGCGVICVGCQSAPGSVPPPRLVVGRLSGRQLRQALVGVGYFE